MTKMLLGGITATTAVLVVGIVIALPPFIQPPRAHVLLSFSIVTDANMPNWCYELASILKQDHLDAIVFFSGEIAEKYPECVRSFDNNVDIGSSTFSYQRLPGIPDYLEQLREVEQGKKAVDLAGNLDSKVFKAPYSSTDENIYSLLSRNGILADFSYEDHYNKYYQKQFIWFNMTNYNASTSFINATYIKNADHAVGGFPFQISIDNTVPLSKINGIIGVLKDDKAVFNSASELTGIQLTVRGNKD
jgi:peptidoglycan/xylan/chitin deacetylase (PgdA/CDA1 family)